MFRDQNKFLDCIWSGIGLDVGQDLDSVFSQSMTTLRSLHGLIFRRCVRCVGSFSQRCLPARGSVKAAGHWQRENGFQIQLTPPCLSASCKTAQFSPDTNANIYVHLSTLIPSVSSETARSLHSAHTYTAFLHGRMSSVTCSQHSSAYVIRSGK